MGNMRAVFLSYRGEAIYTRDNTQAPRPGTFVTLVCFFGNSCFIGNLGDFAVQKALGPVQKLQNIEFDDKALMHSSARHREDRILLHNSKKEAAISGSPKDICRKF